MAGIRMFEEQLQLLTPHTYVGLQKLVMAMAACVNDVGKTTFFGRDKGQKAYSAFLEALKICCHGLVLDGVVTHSSADEEVLDRLSDLLRKFEMAFPNWQESYQFAANVFGPKRSETLALIGRLRSAP